MEAAIITFAAAGIVGALSLLLSFAITKLTEGTIAADVRTASSALKASSAGLNARARSRLRIGVRSKALRREAS